MRLLIAPLLAAGLLSGMMASAAFAQAQGEGKGDQQIAREEMRAGRNMPLRDIERRIISQMDGREFLGSEYDRGASAYRLKFMDRESRQVIWVDVDARNAQILRISR